MGQIILQKQPSNLSSLNLAQEKKGYFLLCSVCRVSVGISALGVFLKAPSVTVLVAGGKEGTQLALAFRRPSLN